MPEPNARLYAGEGNDRPSASCCGRGDRAGLRVRRRRIRRDPRSSLAADAQAGGEQALQLGGAYTFVSPDPATVWELHRRNDEDDDEDRDRDGRDGPRATATGASVTFDLPVRDGEARYQRAGFVHAAARAADPDTNWQLIDVPGAEHDQKAMAAAAQRFLLTPTPPLPHTCPLPGGDTCT